MSQQTEDFYPPELSQYSIAGTASVNSHVRQLQRDRELEVGLARLRIQEAEERIELERMIQQRTKLDSDEYECKSLGDLNKLPIEAPAFLRATERQTDLPRREIQRFAGNPKSYCPSTKAFGSGVENRTNYNHARLDYLIQYCDGPAEASTQHCAILEEDWGYIVAKEVLRKRFGQNHMMTKAHTDEVLDDPRLTDNDSAALVRWADEAALITRSSREPRFTGLTRFVEERADAASLRYGELAISLKCELYDGSRQMKARPNPVGSRRNIHLVQSDGSITRSVCGSRLRCSNCEDSHSPDQCPLFLSKSIVQRFEIVRTRKLCLQCLKANHMAKDRGSNRSCNVQGCERKRHRPLHSDSPVTVAEDATIVTDQHAVGFHLHETPQPSTERAQVALAVIPITVRYGRNIV
ncbi:hypothetical protein PHET_04366 [Paragonimus heterotremus]|uniref:Uncharacterized protein n=1 Tax=Paragonimus heterotremus TaxID=100268 RepID=A0A8J4TMD1_9TREM|nr:hypothetical protein PHET_04366 [Paragonimus heterotremus]